VQQSEALVRSRNRSRRKRLLRVTWFGFGHEDRVNIEALRAIAEASGGRAVLLQGPLHQRGVDLIDQAALQVSAELRNQYTLGERSGDWKSGPSIPITEFASGRDMSRQKRMLANHDSELKQCVRNLILPSSVTHKCVHDDCTQAAQAATGAGEMPSASEARRSLQSRNRGPEMPGSNANVMK
jgi:hypothetical protein